MIDLRENLYFDYSRNGRVRTGSIAVTRIEKLLASTPVRKGEVAVFGDAILDEFIWGEATRISPEAPVPVILLERESWSLGGAANVAANIQALGAQPVLFAACGDDDAGARLRSLVEEQSISIGALVPIPGRPTTVKQRIFAQNKHVLRVDREHADEMPKNVATALLRAWNAALDDVAAVVVSDYAKGAVTGALLRGIEKTCASRGIPLCIDPKSPEVRYRGATVLKPNMRELAVLAGTRVRDEDEINRAAARVLRRHRVQNLLVTRGAQGMLLFNADGVCTRIHSGAQQVADVTGAGDTALAALGMALARGADVREAALLANLAAGLVVTKPGTAVASAEEILHALR